MKTAIGFRFTASTLAAIMLIAPLNVASVPGPPPTANEYDDARKDAEKKVAAADKLAQDCDELKKKAAAAKAAAAAARKKADDLRKAAGDAATAAADAESASGGAGNYRDGKAADAADKAAADASKEADDARDKAQDNPNDKKAQKDARDKENRANEAEKAADLADAKASDRGKGEATTAARKAARAAERAARAAEREAAAAEAAAAGAQALVDAADPCGRVDAARAAADAAIARFERLLAEKIRRTGGSSETEKDTATVDGWKQRVHSPPPKQGTVIPAGPRDTVETGSGNGLKTVTFDAIQGRVIVNLPDDMMAGDTISGTVIIQPKRQSQPEVDRGSGGRSLPLELLFDFSKPIAVPTTGGVPERFTIKIPANLGNDTAEAQIKLALRSKDGSQIHTAMVPISSARSSAVVAGSGQVAPLLPNVLAIGSDFTLPTIAQQGRPVEISGNFDGSSQNTRLLVGGEEIPVLAESSHKAVFRAPTRVTGLTEIVVNERGQETKGQYRSVGVNLSAPKTRLLRGESTTLTIEVSGLQGITEPVPLHLSKGGVVNMEGGDAQTVAIRPAEVQGNGIFKATRTITGLQAGGWNATATVVIFDICLQDESNGNSLIFSSDTGDYVFCGSAPGLNIAIASFDSARGGGKPSHPDLDTVYPKLITRTGAILKGDFRFNEGRIQAQVDRLAHTGSATVQTTNPQRNFTITDRYTRNNTCACPGPEGVQGNEAEQPPVAETTPSATPGGTKLSGSNRKVKAIDLEGQTIHIEGSPQPGVKGLWHIKIKTRLDATSEVFIKSDEMPALKFCDWIKVSKAHDGFSDPSIDSYEKTDDPTPKPPPTGPRPADNATPPAKVTPMPTPEAPPTPPTNPPGDTTARECDPEGAKKTEARTEVTCELSDAAVTKYGISPEGEVLMNIFGAIMKIAGAGKGVKLGEKITGAFSTSALRHIYVKVKKTTTTYKDLYICEHGKWVLKGQDGAPTSETSESGWIKLMNTNNGGTDYWLAGDSTGDVEAGVSLAKQSLGCP